jgi:hypothetical protein
MTLTSRRAKRLFTADDVRRTNKRELKLVQ